MAGGKEALAELRPLFTKPRTAFCLNMWEQEAKCEAKVTGTLAHPNALHCIRMWNDKIQSLPLLGQTPTLCLVRVGMCTWFG